MAFIDDVLNGKYKTSEEKEKLREQQRSNAKKVSNLILNNQNKKTVLSERGNTIGNNRKKDTKTIAKSQNKDLIDGVSNIVNPNSWVNKVISKNKIDNKKQDKETSNDNLFTMIKNANIAKENQKLKEENAGNSNNIILPMPNNKTDKKANIWNKRVDANGKELDNLTTGQQFEKSRKVLPIFLKNVGIGADSVVPSIVNYGNAINQLSYEGLVNKGLIDYNSDNIVYRRQGYLDKKENDRSNKIQENINEVLPYDNVSKKLATVAPSIGENLVSMGVTKLNPVLGTASFMLSAAGKYLNDAKARGMSTDKAFGYATVMGLAEGGSEALVSANMLSSAKKLVTGTGISKKVLGSMGMNIGENFFQEAIMEPLQEATAQAIGGKDTANWDNIWGRMLESGLDGALSALLLQGASVGIASSVSVMGKLKNKIVPTIQEYMKALVDIQNSGKVNTKDVINGAVIATIDGINKNDVLNIQQVQLNNQNNTQVIPMQNKVVENIKMDNEKILYHQTKANSLEEMDLSLRKAGLSDTSTPFGIFLKETDVDIGLEGKNQLKMKAIMKNPLEVKNRNQLKEIVFKYNERYKNIIENEGKTDEYYSKLNSEIETKIDELYEKEYIAQGVEKEKLKVELEKLSIQQKDILDQWTNSGRKIAKVAQEEITKTIKDLGYDSIILKEDEGSLGRKIKSYIVFNKSQLKPAQNKVTQNGLSTELNDILNNKQLPIQNYQYEKSKNAKIDNLRKEASKYFNNSEQTKNFVNMLEKIITDKNVEIRIDSNLMTTDGKIANGSYSDGVITINPNSNRLGEFIAIHELTHAIGTKQMANMIENYKNSNLEFESSIQDLLKNYNINEINEEALADISGQLFGNQEFINDMAKNTPNIFQKIYSEIKYLWHQFRGYKNQNQFVEDLYYKWTQVYNSNNKLNNSSYYSIQNEKLYFRFDNKGGFRGKEHQTGVSMWEYTIDDLLQPNYEAYEDIEGNINFEAAEKEVNDILKMYDTTYEEYNNMSETDQIKIKREIAIDKGLITNGASVFDLTEDGLDFFERYDGDHHETDYPQVNIFTGKHNGWGADGENVVIPNEVFYTGKTQEISDILYDYELTNKQKVDKILDLIEKTYNNSKKMNNANSLYSIQESKNNSKWQDYLEKNFKPTGTRTNLQDIKLPTKEYFENKNIQEVLTDADYEVLNKIYEKEGKTQLLTEKRKAKLLEKYANDKLAIKDSLDILAQKFINKGHYIDQLSQKANNPELKFAYDRNLNSFAEGQYVVGVAQTDNQGNNIGKSINDIWQPIEDSKLTKEFSEYLLHKHNIDRSGRNKFIFGEEIGPTESTAIALELETKHPEFKEYAKNIKEFNHNNLNNLKEAGMLTQDTIDYIEAMYPNYIAISRNLEDNLYTGNNDKTGTKLPLKKATGGNADIQPIKETMAQQSIRIKRLINQNELGKELSKTLKNAIVDEGADISLSPTMLLDIDTMVNTDVNGIKYYLYFEDGKQLKLKINDNLYESLKPTEISKIEKTLPVKALQKVNNIHRSLLTSSNPLFIVTNFFKDFQDGAFNSKYSSKFIKNYGKALNEIYTKGKYYESYMANGGMSNTYFDYETGIKKTNKFVEKIRNANEIVEQLPRLAEFISTLEDGKSLNEALYNASEITTNFKRGGDITKAINRNLANFLNASIQGLDKQFRNFSGQNGAKGYVNLLAKATIMSIIPSILNHILLDDDEDYQDLSQSTKDLYYLFKCDDGKFIRIPKGRVLSIFGAAARRTLETIQGQDDAWDGFGETIINQVAPNNPLEDNILAPITQVKNNKTWYGSDLVSSRLQQELPENQYDETTDEFSKWLGKLTKKSPKKINYLIDQYSGGIGDIILPMITPQAKQNVFVDKFTTDSVLKNKNVSKFYETLEKQTQIANDNFATDEDELQLKYLNGISKDMGNLYKEKRQVQMSNISNKEKTQKVREIQEKINQLAEKGLTNYKNGSQNKNSSKIGDEEYYKNSNGEWTILTDEEKNKNTNISTETYSDYKQKVYNKKNEKVSNGELKKSQDLKTKDKIQILLDSKYSEKEKKSIYENYIKSSNDIEYDIIKQTGINFEQYLKYKQQDFESDKKDDGTTTGKTVSESKKTKVYNYINNMNIDYNQKLVLLGTQYTLTSSEKSKLANYINELSIKKDEKLKIYKKLKGFTVYKDGRVTW